MNIKLIVNRSNGEYSTVVLPDGSIETCWFNNDGSSVVIGREYPQSVASVAEKHIREWEQSK